MINRRIRQVDTSVGYYETEEVSRYKAFIILSWSVDSERLLRSTNNWQHQFSNRMCLTKSEGWVLNLKSKCISLLNNIDKQIAIADKLLSSLLPFLQSPILDAKKRVLISRTFVLIYRNFQRKNTTLRNFYGNFLKHVTGVLFSFVKLRQNFRKFSYFLVN